MSADTQVYRRVKLLSEIASLANTRDNLLARGKCSKWSNKIQDYLASSEHSSHTKANTRYSNTPEKQDMGLKFTFYDDDGGL